MNQLDHSNSHEGLHLLLVHVIQDFMQHMHQSGLSGSQLHVLMHLYHAGECPIAEVGALFGSSPAAASQMVERLVQQGLVERMEDPANRRVKKLHLTERSHALMDQAVSSNRFLMDLMAELTPQQRETIQLALGYLAQAAQKVHSNEGKAKEDA
jgi:DNA-binding MarR family transcriptional regulator